MTLTAQHIISDLEVFEKLVGSCTSIKHLRIGWRSLWEMHTRLIQEHMYQDAEALVVHEALIGIGKGLSIQFCKLDEFKSCIGCLDCVGQGHLFDFNAEPQLA